MAFTLIYGVPGSGKTYFCVHHLLKNFYTFEESSGRYLLKKEFSHVKLVSNIEGLKIEHHDLDDWIRHAQGVEKFFSFDVQKKIFEKHGPIIYLIDEAQMYFPSSFRRPEVFNWFSYHRHWGQTLYLMTQAFSLLPRQITDQVDLSIYALPPSSSLFARRDLKYNVLSGRDIVDKKTLIKSKQIFDVYKSQQANETEKTRNPMMKYIIGIAILLLFIAFKGYSFVSGFGHSSVPVVSAVSAAESPGQNQSKMNEKKPSLLSSSPGEKMILVKVSQLRDSRGIRFFIGNEMFNPFDFPYEVVQRAGKQLYAYVPESDHKRLYPPQQQQQKTEPES